MQRRSIIAMTVAALLLAACGQRADLEPPAGAGLPPTPHGAESPSSAEELLKPGTLAVPERSVEYASVRKSAKTIPSIFRPNSGAGTMDHFALKDGVLHAEDVPLWRIAEEVGRSEEHTSELQSLMRNTYAVF